MILNISNFSAIRFSNSSYRNLDHQYLGCKFLGLCLLQLSDAGCGFGTHDVTSPVTADLENEIANIGLDGFHELSKCTFVLTRSRGKKKKKKREKMVNAVPTLVFR
uniref:Uncharacterized protein n=1 Tax=Astatotilapia calliptera TaxID=8154 RepID=A0AAX7UU62_ASTCA